MVAAVAPVPGVTDKVALVFVRLVCRFDGVQSDRPADPGTNALASMKLTLTNIIEVIVILVVIIAAIRFFAKRPSLLRPIGDLDVT